MITQINHEIRKELKISIMEYCLLDYCHRSKMDTVNSSISEWLGVSTMDVLDMTINLSKLGLIVMAPRSGKFTVTSAWKEVVRPKPKTKERAGDPLNHEFRLLIEEAWKDKNYKWQGYSDYKNADLILETLRFKYKSKYKADGDDKTILDSASFLINSIPHLKFWKGVVFDVKKLANNIESIIGAIHVESRNQTKGKILDSAITIQEASDDFVPKTKF